MNARTETILVVDDDPMIVRALVRYLRGYGYNVVSAPDPNNAIKYYKEIDAAISDWQMPYGGGLRVLQECPAPVIIHSGIAERLPKDLIKKAAVVLAKPATPEELNAALQTVLTVKEYLAS